MSQDTKMILVVAAGVLTAVCGLAYLGARSVESPGRGARNSETTAMPEPALAFVSDETAMPRLDAGPTGRDDAEPIEAVTEPPGTGTTREQVPAPADPVHLAQQGLQAFREGRYGVAAEAFGSLVEGGDRRPWIRYMAALSLWKGGEAERAADLMRQVTVDDPSYVRAWVNLARILNDLGRPAEALGAAQRATESDPEDPGARFLVARSLYNLNRLDEANAALEALLEAHPDHAFAWNLAGLSALRQGRYARAEQAFRRARDSAPEIAFVHNNLGMALELQGRRQEAAAAYARALELDPSHVKAAVNLDRLGVPTVETPPVAQVESGIE